MSADKHRRVLIVDDNRAIHDDFRKILCPATAMVAASDAAEAALFGPSTHVAVQTAFELDSAYQGQEALLLVKKALDAASPYALAFVDVRMPPGWDGVETIQRIWELDPDLQIVLCTAYSDYSWGAMFEKLGSCDGLLILKKPFDSVEAFQMAHALTEKWWLRQQSRRRMQELESRVADRTRELQESNQALQTEIAERGLSESALRESNEKFHQLADNITDAFWIRSPDLREVQYVSPAFERIWGRTVESLRANPHLWADYIVPEDRERVLKSFATLTGDAPTLDIEYRITRPSGEIRWVRVRGFQVRDAANNVSRHVGIVTDITDRWQSEKALRQSEERFRSYFELGLVGMAITSPTKGCVEVNAEICRILGYERSELLRMSWTELTHPEDLPAEVANFNRILSGEIEGYTMDKRYIRKDGQVIEASISVKCLRGADGSVDCVVGLLYDITERKRLETQLFRARKLETIGKLAGGIAHEFNSLTTAIIGHSEVLLKTLVPGDPLIKNATEIQRGAERVATLTRQLLAYGRKQTLRPLILSLNSVLAGMEKEVRNLVGRGVELKIVPAQGLGAVRADPEQIEQVVMNLAMNAAEAMPDGGTLTLETANATLDQEYVKRFPEMRAGEYVKLTIADTGEGMNEEKKTRVFEPFFSTKGVGRGKGLGLSTCYGIIKQSGGHLDFESAPGHGTTFSIYLPQVDPRTRTSVPRSDLAALPRGTETILLVEDDATMREMGASLLRRLGYRVFVAADGIEALGLKQRHDLEHTDLLFTDLVMPNMSGTELCERLRASDPHIKCLFTSAYTEYATGHQDMGAQGAAFLPKPFTPFALAQKLQEMLDEPESTELDAVWKTRDSPKETRSTPSTP